MLVRNDSAAAIDLLIGSGYSAIPARNGLEALHLLRSGVQPLAMLIDLHMPLMDGEDFCVACAAEPRFASIPRILMSGNVDARTRLGRCGATAFVPKPIQVDRLLDALRISGGPVD